MVPEIVRTIGTGGAEKKDKIPITTQEKNAIVLDSSLRIFPLAMTNLGPFALLSLKSFRSLIAHNKDEMEEKNPNIEIANHKIVSILMA